MNNPPINIIHHEENPKNRKDVVLMFLKAIRDASKSGNINEEINSTINFLISAIPEIPEGQYDRKMVFLLEPDFYEEADIYFKNNPMLVNELKTFYFPRIKRLCKEKYLRRLQYERVIIEDLLKKHVNWYFEKTKEFTMAR